MNHTTAAGFLLGAALALSSCVDARAPKSAAAAPAPLPAAVHSEAGAARPLEVADPAAERPDATALPSPIHPLTDSAWLGVELRDLEPGQSGVRIQRVFRGSPAYFQGLRADDVLLSIDGKPLTGPGQVHAVVEEGEPGKTLSIVLDRHGATRLYKIELGSQPEPEDMMRLHFVGARAPDFSGITPVHGEVPRSLGNASGSVVVLEFWARWCGVCRYLVPIMNHWYSDYRPQGVVFLGLTSDPFELADRTARELDMQYPIAVDASDATSVAYGVNAVPMVFVIDQRGVVRDVMVGLRKARIEDLQALVERLLANG